MIMSWDTLKLQIWYVRQWIYRSEPSLGTLRKAKNPLSHVMRLCHFSSSVNSFFKRACAAIQWGFMSDFGDLHTSCVRTAKALARLARMRSFAWAFAVCLCDEYHNLMSSYILHAIRLQGWSSLSAHVILYVLVFPGSTNASRGSFDYWIHLRIEL